MVFKLDIYMSKEKYIFEDHKPEYKDFFITEKKKLIKIIGSKVKIEHVGSTAILGLGGKGILDIAIGVLKSKMQDIKTELETEYTFSQEYSTSERLYFKKQYTYKNKTRRVHLHLIELGGEEWNQFIAFRDYLNKHPKIVEEYSNIKKEAVNESLEGEKYRAYKYKFIVNTIDKALKYFDK